MKIFILIIICNALSGCSTTPNVYKSKADKINDWIETMEDMGFNSVINKDNVNKVKKDKINEWIDGMEDSLSRFEYTDKDTVNE